jgi:hypothetical protein
MSALSNEVRNQITSTITEAINNMTLNVEQWRAMITEGVRIAIEDYSTCPEEFTYEVSEEARQVIRDIIDNRDTHIVWDLMERYGFLAHQLEQQIEEADYEEEEAHDLRHNGEEQDRDNVPFTVSQTPEDIERISVAMYGVNSVNFVNSGDSSVVMNMITVTHQSRNNVIELDNQNIIV